MSQTLFAIICISFSLVIKKRWFNANSSVLWWISSLFSRVINLLIYTSSGYPKFYLFFVFLSFFFRHPGKPSFFSLFLDSVSLRVCFKAFCSQTPCILLKEYHQLQSPCHQLNPGPQVPIMSTWASHSHRGTSNYILQNWKSHSPQCSALIK